MYGDSNLQVKQVGKERTLREKRPQENEVKNFLFCFGRNNYGSEWWRQVKKNIQVSVQKEEFNTDIVQKSLKVDHTLSFIDVSSMWSFTPLGKACIRKD